MRSKVLCVTTELSRHVGTTTLAQIQCHGAPLVRKNLNQILFNFSSCIPSLEDLLLSLQSVARRLKSSFISSSFFAFLLSHPSILPAPPGLSPPHFFLVRPLFCVLLLRWGWWLIVGFRVRVFRWGESIRRSATEADPTYLMKRARFGGNRLE